jgi:hypothetical protein
MRLAIDIHRVGKTMAACSPSPIRSFGPSGPLPTAYRLRSVASSLSGSLRLQLQRGFTDADLDHAVRAALTADPIGGLIPQPLPANLVSRAASLSCGVT